MMVESEGQESKMNLNSVQNAFDKAAFLRRKQIIQLSYKK